jgi:TrmH family RNA methyltransferase
MPRSLCTPPWQEVSLQRRFDTRQFHGDDYVDSPRNSRVRDVARLYKRSERDRRGVLLAEGVWALRTALQGRADVLEVYYCVELLRDDVSTLLDRARRGGAHLTRVSTRALQRMSYRDGPDGMASVVAKPVAALERPSGCPLICVVEAIEKPGNLGAIIRTACAAGAEMVVVTDPLVDVYAPAVVRASLGALFLVPVVVTTSAEATAWMRHQRIAICATTPQGTSDPWTVDLTRPTAVVIGNEHRGLGRLWLDAADVRLRIPMLGPMNSLNASTAAGIVLFEAVRQRER